MKKAILSLSVLGLLFMGAQTAKAEWDPLYLNPLQYMGVGPNYTSFTLNPFKGFKNCDPCPLPERCKCEKPKKEKCVKIDPCDKCTGAAAPVDKCKCKKEKVKKNKCNACEKAKPCDKCQKAFEHCDKSTGAAAPISKPCNKCIKKF